MLVRHVIVRPVAVPRIRAERRLCVVPVWPRIVASVSDVVSITAATVSSVSAATVASVSPLPSIISRPAIAGSAVTAPLGACRCWKQHEQTKPQYGRPECLNNPAHFPLPFSGPKLKQPASSGPLEPGEVHSSFWDVGTFWASEAIFGRGSVERCTARCLTANRGIFSRSL